MSDEEKQELLEKVDPRIQEDEIVILESYDELVDRIKKKADTEITAAVMFRWTVGAHVKLALETAVYGSHKMDDLIEDLGWGSRMLYACKNLYETFTRKQMESDVLPLKLPFRSLNYLVHVKDPDERLEKMKLVAEGKLKAQDCNKTPEQLAAAGGDEEPMTIPEVGEGGEDRTPAQTAASQIRSRIHQLEEPLSFVLNRTEPVLQALPDLDEVAADDDLYEAVQSSLQDFKVRVDEAEEQLARLKEELERRV